MSEPLKVPVPPAGGANSSLEVCPVKHGLDVVFHIKTLRPESMPDEDAVCYAIGHCVLMWGARYVKDIVDELDGTGHQVDPL
jgi:hypothetical protein